MYNFRIDIQCFKYDPFEGGNVNKVNHGTIGLLVDEKIRFI